MLNQLKPKPRRGRRRPRWCEKKSWLSFFGLLTPSEKESNEFLVLSLFSCGRDRVKRESESSNKLKESMISWFESIVK